MSAFGPCPSCRAPVQSHTTCPHCGHAVGDIAVSEQFLPVVEPAYGIARHRAPARQLPLWAVVLLVFLAPLVSLTLLVLGGGLGWGLAL